MKIQHLALASTAAVALGCALIIVSPGQAQQAPYVYKPNYYNTNPTPAERAQTSSLNSEQATDEGTAPNEFTDTTADIELLDLAGAAAPTTLVSGAGAGMFLTSDRQSLVYSLPSGAHPGVYMMRLP